MRKSISSIASGAAVMSIRPDRFRLVLTIPPRTPPRTIEGGHQPSSNWPEECGLEFMPPEELKTIRRQNPKLRVKHGPWRQEAGRDLLAAATKGQLNVYVVPDLELISRRQGTRLHATTMRVPPAVIKRFITVRGTLPDHAYRPSLKTTEGNKELLFALEPGLLVVNAFEYETWYRHERAKGKWPSQRHQGTYVPGRGRPTKQTGRLRDAIVALVRGGDWTAKAGFNELRRLLIRTGHDDCPNAATLRTVVERLWVETGEDDFRCNKRYRRRNNVVLTG